MVMALDDTSTLSFHPPRFEAPFDLSEHLKALPPNASIKGMFHQNLLEQAAPHIAASELLQKAGLPEQKYTAFRDYPYADFIHLAVAAAPVLHPGVSMGEGLRRIGRTAYGVLSSSLAGKVVFGVLGRDVERIVAVGPRGWQMVLNFGQIRAETVEPRHVRYHFRDMPVLLETVQVGVVEGALEHCRVQGEVRIAMQDLGNAVFDIRWQ